MRPLRLLLLSLFMSFTATVLVLYTILGSSQDEHPGRETTTRPQDDFKTLFSFTSPGSLFPPSAIISLTDDNSTFFLARPAAFGPSLPKDGLSSPLWIGSGFGEESFYKGELGCSDSSDWDGHNGEQASRPNSDGPSTSRNTTLKGKIALLKRGSCGFLAKVQWAQTRGAVAVIVGDDVRGGGLIRMYAKGDTSNITIPSVFTSHTTAHLLSSLLAADSTTQPNPPLRTLSSATTKQQDQSRWTKWFNTRPNKHEPPTNTPTLGTVIPSLTGSLHGDVATLRDEHGPRQSLWITLTPTSVSTSPFLDTLLVLVVSPLVTLTVVYALLVLRSRIRRRRWRAPKSLVERLPVRTYHTISSTSSSTPSPSSSSLMTPLLHHHPTQPLSPRINPEPDREPEITATSSLLHQGDRTREEEKRDTGLAEWRRRYKSRQRECVVCLDEYEDGISQVMSLPCGHEFHAECITPWLVTRRRTCPICKGDVVRALAQSYHDRLPALVSAPALFNPQTEDETQAQAVAARNGSPTASLPIPVTSPDPISQPNDFTAADVEANWTANNEGPDSEHNAIARDANLGSPTEALTTTLSAALRRGFQAVRSTTTPWRRSPDIIDRDR